MMSKTHLSIASAAVPFLYAVIGQDIRTSILAVTVGTAVGTLIPDIDSPNSMAGKALRNEIGDRYGHRTLTHSFIGLLISWALIFGAMWLFSGVLNPIFVNAYHIAFSYFLAFTVHIFSDMFTKDGVMLFWPFSTNRYCVPLDETKRLTVGGAKETEVLKAALGFAALFLILHFMGGPYKLLYYINHKAPAAIAVIRNDMANYEYTIKVKGKWTESNVEFDDKHALVLGMNKEETDLILRDTETGEIYSAYCRGNVIVKASAVLDEVFITKKVKSKLTKGSMKLTRGYINSELIPDNSYIKGSIVIGKARYDSEKFREYMLGAYKAANITEDRFGTISIEFNYLPGSELKAQMPVYVEKGELEIIYR